VLKYLLIIGIVPYVGNTHRLHRNQVVPLQDIPSLSHQNTSHTLVILNALTHILQTPLKQVVRLPETPHPVVRQPVESHRSLRGSLKG
jgi:hypothetical protein